MYQRLTKTHRTLDHTTTAYLGYSEDHISRSSQRSNFPSEFVAHNLRQYHANGLAQHHSLSLNATNTYVYVTNAYITIRCKKYQNLIGLNR